MGNRAGPGRHAAQRRATLYLGREMPVSLELPPSCLLAFTDDGEDGVMPQSNKVPEEVLPMRRIALMLTVLAALSLAACNNSSSNGQKAAKAVAVANSVTGSISLMKPRQLSSKATMTIQLVDSSNDAAAPLASKTVAPVTKMPVDYSLDFDRAKINPADIYLVKVDLTDGERTFSMAVQSPVITRDAPTSKVDIVLVANKTPAEMLEDQYAKLQKNLGAYQISNGRELEKDESRGWQTFRSNDDGKIVFVRENVDHGKQGFFNSEFAYRDDKPWFVVVKKKASQSAKPSDVMRAGWNADGKLVVRENSQGGNTDTLSDADASQLMDKAEAMLKLAKAKSPARRKR